MTPGYIKRKKKTKLIAHRGLCAAETENTVAAFIAAANRSYWGIETDVRLTSDGKFVLMHDDHTGRLSEKDLVISQTPFDTIRQIVLKDKNGCNDRADLGIPTLAEYISICRAYGKKSVLEIKGRFPTDKLEEMKCLIEDMGQLGDTVFISFEMANLDGLRKMLPDHPMQFLSYKAPGSLIDELSSKGFGLDIHYPAADRALVKALKKAGVELNCWTVNDPSVLHKLISLGAEYLTTENFE
ncbi:MAG: hypothetical protein IJV00_09385 [Clostridia bacterium]|nr:hypothetical protein [Clostridia bacterium]